MPDIKTYLGITAALMTVAAHVPYLRHTFNATNKLHIFTWIIWTILTGIAFCIQWSEQAGPGAWVTGLTAIICLIITLAALRSGEKNITRSDWFMFLAALTAIPLWAVTNSPLVSIILVTVIDCSAFVPTCRKSWHKPFEENSFMYGFNIPRHVISIFSIANLSVVTALYPCGLLLMNIITYVMLKMRRWVSVARQSHSEKNFVEKS